MSEEARSCHRATAIIALFAFKAEKAPAGWDRFEHPLTASHLRDIGVSRHGIPLWPRLPLIKADRLLAARLPTARCHVKVSLSLSLELPVFSHLNKKFESVSKAGRKII